MILYFLVDFGFFDSCIAVKMFHPSKLGLFKFGLMGNRNKFWLNRPHIGKQVLGGLILMTMMLMMMILKMMPIMTTKMSMKTICDVINKSGSNDFVNRACYYTKQRTL